MADDYQLPSNGNGNGNGAALNGNNNGHHTESSMKPLLELYVKASGIDARRIGADIFCQEFWMELYALYEIGVARVEVKTVNVNSEAFKRNFLGAQPPILIEEDKQATYTDNREIEGRIFHLAKQYGVPLFEKDQLVEKCIEGLYRNFKLFLRAKTEFDKGKKEPSPIEATPPQIKTHCNRIVEQLNGIDQVGKRVYSEKKFLKNEQTITSFLMSCMNLELVDENGVRL
ncbi:hypothetical protein WR25_13391 isoform D [Diploscapter pachys]|uniref:CLIC N-terminal domain-containing protein n=1 Tax=Diploscapter pachys TaxID=2018661 RepID=A0A2A2J3D1_9BILA|nr:hypothetical protein WR25_13391 isoform B [Diploscapter pachys]PAV56167.1 hypothetical protein WR25_13391 isoform D [Diploscapter pachys]